MQTHRYRYIYKYNHTQIYAKTDLNFKLTTS